METVLVICASLAAAYAIARVQGQARFARTDLLIGLFAGVASATMAQHVGAEGVGLPIFFGCSLTLALAPLRRRSLWH